MNKTIFSAIILLLLIIGSFGNIAGEKKRTPEQEADMFIWYIILVFIMVSLFPLIPYIDRQFKIN
jgi:Mg2+ and Co2+ transporter CorA